jgi:hypothetical protein
LDDSHGMDLGNLYYCKFQGKSDIDLSTMLFGAVEPFNCWNLFNQVGELSFDLISPKCLKFVKFGPSISWLIVKLTL